MKSLNRIYDVCAYVRTCMRNPIKCSDMFLYGQPYTLRNSVATYYSADTRTMNAMAFFHFICTFVHGYFVVIFYIFPELTNHIREPKQSHRHFFSCFPVFILPSNVCHAFRRKKGGKMSRPLHRFAAVIG